MYLSIATAVSVLFVLFNNYATVPVNFQWVKSDILYSARFTRGEALDNQAFEKAKTYAPTSLVWHYAQHQTKTTENISKSFILANFISNVGVRNQCAINYYPKYIEEVCYDLYDQPVLGGWEKTFDVLGRGDTNKKQFLERQWSRMKYDLDQGCRHFQQDTADLNFGTLRYGGCFSAEGDVKFREYLKVRLTADELKQVGVADATTFSYKKFLLDQRMPGGLSFYAAWKNTKHPLVEYYEDFNRLSTENFIRELRERAQVHIGQPVTIFGNLYKSRESNWIYRYMDGAMTELSEKNATLGNLVQEVAISQAMGRPNHIWTLTSPDVAVNRRVLATAYALGAHMIMPTDVYVGTGLPRVDIAASEIGDILDLVRKQKRLLNGYQKVDSAGIELTNSITKITLDSVAGRVLVYHSRSNELPNITRGARAVIGGETFQTVADTTVGIIYLPLGSEKRVSVGMNVDLIENPNHLGIDFTGQIGRAGPTIRKITTGNVAGVVFLQTSLGVELGGVAQGSVFRVADRQFEVAANSTIGLLAIKQDQLVPGLIGAEILQLDNAAGFSFDYTVDRARAPRLLSAEQLDGRAVVKLSSGLGSVIPRGTYLELFNGAVETIADSNVGLAYLDLDQLTNLIPGTLVSFARFPDGKTVDFRNKSPGAFVKSNVGAWLISVSRAGNDRKKSVLHIVDRLDGRREMKFTIRLVDVFSAVPKKFYLHEGQKALREVFITSIGNGWYQVTVPGIRTWGILEPVW